MSWEPDMTREVRISRVELVDEHMMELIDGQPSQEVSERVVCMLSRSLRYYVEAFEPAAALSILQTHAETIRKGTM